MMNWKRRARYILTAAFLVVMSCSGCSLHPESYYDKKGKYMDKTVSLREKGKKE